MAVPLVAGANLLHKSGTMNITVEGKGDPITAFKAAVIQNGGMVPQISNDYARGEFADVAVKIEIQVLDGGKKVLMKGSSATSVARTYELSDGIGETTIKVAQAMQGYKITLQQRDRAI
jgi:lipopolysaccharide export system protein LptA